VLAALAAGAAAPLVALATYNMLVFGGPLTLSYEFSTQTHRHAGWVMGLGKPNLDALAKITFSSYRGLFFSAPWLLLALPGAIAWWRRGYRAEVGVCAAIIVLFVWLDASLVDWDGGWAMGPRYLVPALPFLVVLAGGVLVGELPRIAIGAIAVAIGVSIVLMLIGTSVEPAVAVTVKRPFQDFLLPHFAHGELGRSTQSVDMMTHPDHGRMQAWNLGNAVGLDGYASLLPLLAAWIACGIWTVRPRSRAQLDVGRSAAPSMP
jgi:hypothetical protein